MTSVAVTIIPESKTFDYTAAVTSISFELNPSIPDLLPYLNTNVTASMFQFDSADAGPHTASLKAGSAYPPAPTGYAFTWTISGASITKATIPVNVAAVKTYDGNTIVSPSSFSAIPSATGELLNYYNTNIASSYIAANFTYDTKNVGSGKTLTPNFTITDPNVNITNIYNASITYAYLTVTINNVIKIYDGTTTATSNDVTYSGLVGGDTSSGFTTTIDNLRFAGKNIGIASLVYDSVTTTGATNYSITYQTGTGTIDKKLLTTSGVSANSKTYDGATSAVASGTPILAGVIIADSSNVSATATASFADKNVGTGKTVTITYSLSGTEAGNYSAPSPTMSSADITKKSLTATGVTATNKTYDGTTSAVASGTPILSGVIIADSSNVSATATASFADKNVGNGKTVTITYSLSGTEAGNYSAPSPTSSAAEISKAPLSVDFSVQPKEYDGLTTASVTQSISGFKNGETGTVSIASANFNNSSVGTGKAVTVVASATAPVFDNYTVSYNPPSGNITSKTLSVTGVTANNKEFDGTTAATTTGTPVLTGVVAPESVTASVSMATFASAAVGTNKPVTVAFTLSSTTQDNYTLPNSILYADITSTAPLPPPLNQGTVSANSNSSGSFETTRIGASIASSNPTLFTKGTGAVKSRNFTSGQFMTYIKGAR